METAMDTLLPFYSVEISPLRFDYKDLAKRKFDRRVESLEYVANLRNTYGGA